MLANITMGCVVIGVMIAAAFRFEGFVAEIGVTIAIFGLILTVIALIGELFIDIAEKFEDKQQHNTDH